MGNGTTAHQEASTTYSDDLNAQPEEHIKEALPTTDKESLLDAGQRAQAPSEFSVPVARQVEPIDYTLQTSDPIEAALSHPESKVTILRRWASH